VVQRFPCIKLHFSGHFHLSQNYPDAISIVGGTAFVLTGVIGDASSRDGQRQSRILRGSEDGYEVYTVDHDANSMRLDLKGSWEVLSKPQYLVPEGDLLCDPASGWLCSKVQCDVEPLAPPDMSITWLNIGPAAMLTLQDEVSRTARGPHWRHIVTVCFANVPTCPLSFLFVGSGAGGVRCAYHGPGGRSLYRCP
jgi:hypothetical protein